MIPRAYITEWKARQAPWPLEAQVEQDLILSRAIAEIYSDSFLKEHLAFRGGTALHKLFLAPSSRHSEDIDLVQVQSEPIGPTMAALRARLDSWLGKPAWKQNKGRVTMFYEFEPEVPPITPVRIKVEVNTREHFSVLDFRRTPYSVESRWYRGSVQILTYEPEELLGTKLRALYQRRKGRDLFDLAAALDRLSGLDLERIVTCFLRYLQHDGQRVSRAEFECNMVAKMNDPVFHGDIGPLLATSVSLFGAPYDAQTAYAHVHKKLIAKLPGEPWKGIEAKTPSGGV